MEVRRTEKFKLEMLIIALQGFGIFYFFDIWKNNSDYVITSDSIVVVVSGLLYFNVVVTLLLRHSGQKILNKAILFQIMVIFQLQLNISKSETIQELDLIIYPAIIYLIINIVFDMVFKEVYYKQKKTINKIMFFFVAAIPILYFINRMVAYTLYPIMYVVFITSFLYGLIINRDVLVKIYKRVFKKEYVIAIIFLIIIQRAMTYINGYENMTKGNSIVTTSLFYLLVNFYILRYIYIKNGETLVKVLPIRGIYGYLYSLLVLIFLAWIMFYFNINLMVMSIIVYVIIFFVELSIVFQYFYLLESEYSHEIGIYRNSYLADRMNASDREYGLKKSFQDYIHNDICQSLSVIRNEVSNSGCYGNSEDKEFILEVIDDLLLNLREKMRDLDESIRNDISLRMVYIELLENIQKKYPSENIAMTVNIIEEFTLYPPYDLEVFKMVMELVNNSYKHSKGTTIEVNIDIYNDILHLFVEDDGVSSNMDDIFKIDEYGGLKAIRDKVEEFEGTIVVSNIKNGGFRVDLKIPLKYE